MGLHETFSVFASQNNRMTTHKVSAMVCFDGTTLSKLFQLIRDYYECLFLISRLLVSISAFILKVKGIICVVRHKYFTQIRVSVTEN